jgi:hypothetical protein
MFLDLNPDPKITDIHSLTPFPDRKQDRPQCQLQRMMICLFPVFKQISKCIKNRHFESSPELLTAHPWYNASVLSASELMTAHCASVNLPTSWQSREAEDKRMLIVASSSAESTRRYSFASSSDINATITHLIP